MSDGMKLLPAGPDVDTATEYVLVSEIFIKGRRIGFIVEPVPEMELKKSRPK